MSFQYAMPKILVFCFWAGSIVPLDKGILLIPEGKNGRE
jgi:hypothetical protein